MRKGEQWWKNLTESLENNPEFIAEGIAQDLAISVHRRLEKAGISRKDLADRLNVSRAHISQILSGKTNMTILSICRTAAALELRPEVRFIFQAPGINRW